MNTTLIVEALGETATAETVATEVGGSRMMAGSLKIQTRIDPAPGSEVSRFSVACPLLTFTVRANLALDAYAVAALLQALAMRATDAMVSRKKVHRYAHAIVAEAEVAPSAADVNPAANDGLMTGQTLPNTGVRLTGVVDGPRRRHHDTRLTCLPWATTGDLTPLTRPDAKARSCHA
jgi:hypothetical protein